MWRKTPRGRRPKRAGCREVAAPAAAGATTLRMPSLQYGGSGKPKKKKNHQPVAAAVTVAATVAAVEAAARQQTPTNPSTAQTRGSPPRQAAHSGQPPRSLSSFTPHPLLISCSFCSPFSPSSSRVSPGKNGSTWESRARREALEFGEPGVGGKDEGQDYSNSTVPSGLHYGRELFHAPRLRGGVKTEAGARAEAARKRIWHA